MDYAFGLVRYLNTSPFRWGLRALGHTRWVNEVPARLLALLQQGQVEAAIVPAFDVLSHRGLMLVPGSCIACHGPARSVCVFSRIPLRQAGTVALDTSSHTSAALVRILMAEWGCRPAFVAMEPDLDHMLAEADAALLIGDPCMRASPSGLIVTDLGDAWRELTGLPFVFALWAARPGADRAGLAQLIAQARDRGLADVEDVAAQEAARLGLDRELCLQYLRDEMRYQLDDAMLAGLERYRSLCVRHGLLPDAG